MSLNYVSYTPKPTLQTGDFFCHYSTVVCPIICWGKREVTCLKKSITDECITEVTAYVLAGTYFIKAISRGKFNANPPNTCFANRPY